jgi:chromosome partitioning protein
MDRTERDSEPVRRPVSLAVINMKGGSAKTTVALNLAYFAAFGGHNTLLVDLDPQASASIYALGPAPYKDLLNAGRPTIYELFERFTPGRPWVTLADIVHSIRRNWDLLPSKLEFSWVLKSPTGREQALKRILDSEASDYELVIIDCPPTESVFTTAAYLASQWLLVPVIPEPLASIGFPLLDKSLQEFKNLYGWAPSVAGIAFARIQGQPWEAEVKADVTAEAARLHLHVFNTEVRWSRSYVRGSGIGTAIDRTPYAHWDKIQEMRALANEVFTKIGV